MKSRVQQLGINLTRQILNASAGLCRIIPAVQLPVCQSTKYLRIFNFTVLRKANEKNQREQRGFLTNREVKLGERNVLHVFRILRFFVSAIPLAGINLI